MTLLTNEIHVQKDPRNSTIIFAADRRISIGNKFHSNRKKIFEIQYLNAGIGYFGLAEVHHRNKAMSMSEWLPQFITNNNSIKSLEVFSSALQAELNSIVPKNIKTSNPSGFHIAGFNKSKLPEFWFVRNIKSMDGFSYKDLMDHYEITEDFLSRDAIKNSFGIHSLKTFQPYIQTYRNGDIRAHVVAWERLDSIIGDFLTLPDFRKLNTLTEYEEFIKFKMILISSIYKKYCNKSIIGTPIDVFSILPK